MLKCPTFVPRSFIAPLIKLCSKACQALHMLLWFIYVMNSQLVQPLLHFCQSSVVNWIQSGLFGATGLVK